MAVCEPLEEPEPLAGAGAEIARSAPLQHTATASWPSWPPKGNGTPSSSRSFLTALADVGRLARTGTLIPYGGSGERRGSCSFPELSYDAAVAALAGGDVLVEQPTGPRRFCFSRCGGRIPEPEVWCSLDLEQGALVWQRCGASGPPKVWFFSELLEVTPLVVGEHKWTSASPQHANDFLVKSTEGSARFRASDRQAVKRWVTALQHHARGNSRRRRRCMTDGPDLMNIARVHFRRADADGDGHIAPAEAQALLRRLGLCEDAAYLAQMSANESSVEEALSEDAFLELFVRMMVKKPLLPYFEQYGTSDKDGSYYVSWRRLARFAKEVQGDRRVYAKALAAQLRELGEPLVNRRQTGLTRVGFCAYVCSPSNSIFDPARACLHQDMTRPLSHYWISCSHNTYLEDHQIVGKASCEQYINVVRQGCRCVEIDCWDGPSGEPVVTHGHTMVNCISFEEVACALRDHAFVSTPFPLILSLEMHCSDEQVLRIGEILAQTLGSALLVHPDGMHEGVPLVSPESAKYRFIVKAKLLQEPKHMSAVATSMCSWSSKVGTNFSGTHAAPSWSCKAGTKLFGASAAPRQAVSDQTARDAPEPRMAGDLLEGIAEYNRSVYLVSKKFADLDVPRHPCTITSLSVLASVKQAKRYGQRLNAHHRDFLTRVYPHGLQSSNMWPIPHWMHGAQMVAMNYQTKDKAMLLNHGMFCEQNGGHGYVLKPGSVMNAREVDANSPATRFQVTPLSAHCLPRVKGAEGEVKPLIVVGVHGHELDSASYEAGCAINDGGSVERKSVFEFFVRWEDVAIITLEVFHQESSVHRLKPVRTLIVAAAFPVHGLRAGLRWVPLRDTNGVSRSGCGLLVKLEISKPRTHVFSWGLSHDSLLSSGKAATRESELSSMDGPSERVVDEEESEGQDEKGVSEALEESALAGLPASKAHRTFAKTSPPRLWQLLAAASTAAMVAATSLPSSRTTVRQTCGQRWWTTDAAAFLRALRTTACRRCDQRWSAAAVAAFAASV